MDVINGLMSELIMETGRHDNGLTARSCPARRRAAPCTKPSPYQLPPPAPAAPPRATPSSSPPPPPSSSPSFLHSDLALPAAPTSTRRGKMSVIDILTRVDVICKKYDKYDVEKQKDSNISGEDAFARLYTVVGADIEATEQVNA